MLVILKIVFTTIFLTIIMKMTCDMALKGGEALWHMKTMRKVLQRKQVFKNQIIAYIFNKYATGYLCLPGN